MRIKIGLTTLPHKSENELSPAAVRRGIKRIFDFNSTPNGAELNREFIKKREPQLYNKRGKYLVVLEDINMKKLFIRTLIMLITLNILTTPTISSKPDNNVELGIRNYE